MVLKYLLSYELYKEFYNTLTLRCELTFEWYKNLYLDRYLSDVSTDDDLDICLISVPMSWILSDTSTDDLDICLISVQMIWIFV